ncbi:MAG: hypothetical protein H7Z14_10840 [Anaerolineae bacterium]|nr:hypothetical protein [Phycisphaerae bacterium]
MLSKRISKLLLTGAVVGGMAGVANAGLNIDVRATGVNGAPLGAGQTSKLIPVAAAGDVVSFDIFAVVTGTNATLTDDKILSVSGSFRSTGALLGTLAADYVRSVEEPPFSGYDAPGASVGLQQDLDGDGDLDVGSLNDGAAANFWAARFILTSGQSAGVGINGRRIGFGTFTVGAGGGQTVVNFVGRSAATAANYFQDNVTVAEASQDGALGITILGGTLPDPATLSLAGLAGLALGRRRRA